MLPSISIAGGSNVPFPYLTTTIKHQEEDHKEGHLVAMQQMLPLHNFTAVTVTLLRFTLWTNVAIIYFAVRPGCQLKHTNQVKQT